MSFPKHYAKVMRLFHNRIKCDLIRKASCEKSDVHLLDIGVGRGGDMFKWDQCSVDYAIGYDPECSYIEEAKRRFSHSNLNGKRDYHFVHALSMDSLKLPDQSMDIVSCQFAIHYFFQSESMLVCCLEQIQRVLRSDGIFIGTFMDGNIVMDHTCNSTNTYSNEAMMMYVPNETENKNAFALPLKVYLTGTLYFGENTVSNEYVVFKDVLQRFCEKVGLELVEFKLFQTYHQEYQNDFNMNSDCTKCSYMYSSFMFRKTRNT
jgi:mRNA (guanine-N7-)-methyltransferase